MYPEGSGWEYLNDGANVLPWQDSPWVQDPYISDPGPAGIPGVTDSPATGGGVNNAFDWNGLANGITKMVSAYGSVRAIDSATRRPIYPQNAMPITLPDGSVLRQTWTRAGSGAAGGSGMLLLILAGLAFVMAAN